MARRLRPLLLAHMVALHSVIMHEWKGELRRIGGQIRGRETHIAADG